MELACLKPLSGRHRHKPSTLIPLDGNIKEENTRKISNKIRYESYPHKKLTPPSTQNLKAMGLWVLFLICWSTFSFLLNVRLRLTWIHNNFPQVKVPSTFSYPLSGNIFKHEHLTNDPYPKPLSIRLLILGSNTMEISQ